MKKKFTILVLIFAIAFTNAQIANIDPAFKTFLLTTTDLNNLSVGFGWDDANSLPTFYGAIDTNNDGEIQLSEANAVTSISIANSNLISINDLTAFSNLKSISLGSNNLLTSVNFYGLFHLKILRCNNNSQLTSINTSGLIELVEIDCTDNQITTLDLSSSKNINTVACSSNNLISLFIKNGRDEILYFGNNPNLSYICADNYSNGISPSEMETIQNNLISAGYTNCSVTDYCSFTPNGNYNTLSGNALYDNENDGCDINDADFEFLRINLTDGTTSTSGSTFTNALGNYTFYTNAGNFILTPQLENPTYFAVSPTSVPVTFADNLNNVAANNFCITPNGVHNDLEVVLAQVTPARPGFDAEYSLVYKNKGNQPLSGAVSVTYDDAKLDFVSATIAPTATTTGNLSWSYTNLLPFENRSITFTLNVNAPTETPAVNNGDILAFNVTITPLTGDEIPTDNTHTFSQTVVGSFDPNDIYCLEGETVDPSKIGEYLHYNVRFENTGTFEAENIVVTTTINSGDYDLNSLQVLNASHNVYTRLKGNLVEFVFENIQLEGSPNNGHGYLLFKIRSSSTLQTNDQITANANIYFDYNFPVVTNDATTTFQVLSNQDFIKDDSISIYPNPTSAVVNINSDSTIKSIELYDVQGRLLQTKIQNQTEVVFDIYDKSNGIYFLKITSDKGSKVEKIVKK